MKQMKLQKKLFKLLKNRYQNNLEWIKGSEFSLDYVDLMYYVVLLMLCCIISIMLYYC